jgi:hypothetical protein
MTGSPRLIILDWDIAQIEGGVLEHWLPSVFLTLEELAQLCRARLGSAGAFIEDKNSGQSCYSRPHAAACLRERSNRN